MSKTFKRIHKLVSDEALDNNNGFRANDVINLANNLNPNTVKTFLPKHCKTNIIYFERIQRGLYKIIDNHL